MSTENVPASSINDENNILKRSKANTTNTNATTSNDTEPTTRPLQTRAVLSNVTNTIVSTAIDARQVLATKQTNSSTNETTQDTKNKKRPATQSSNDLAENIQQHQPKRQKTEQEWEDLDAEDIDDPLMVSEYVVEIFDYLSELEIKTLPDSTYLTWQTNMRPKMRTILVDWIVEVHLRFRLLPETLFLAINIMDRFMSKEIVEVDKLQLLATGSLFVAAKYEEVFSPSVKNYSYVTDGGYSEEEILEAERYILQTLEFNLSYPNPMNFLRRISKADDYDIETRTIGKYLLEISIMDHRFIGIKPSLCAAAAMFVAKSMLKRSEWNSTLIHYSGYTKSEMKDTVELLLKYLVEPVVHEEFFKKYASKRYMKSSILARQWAKKVNAEELDILADVVDGDADEN